MSNGGEACVCYIFGELAFFLIQLQPLSDVKIDNKNVVFLSCWADEYRIDSMPVDITARMGQGIRAHCGARRQYNQKPYTRDESDHKVDIEKDVGRQLNQELCTSTSAAFPWLWSIETCSGRKSP